MKSTFKLQLYSISTLFALFGMIFALLSAILYLSDVFSITIAIVFTIAANIIMLFLNPIIMDYTNKWIFKTKYYSYDELKANNFKFADFLMKLSKKHNIDFPRIGIIDDGSITAYTYGSMQNNARIVLTRGIIEILSEDELNAVISHEFGHIKHRDFIVMTIASTILQLLYLIYIYFRFSSSNSDKDKKSSALVFALISYVFYIIASYVVLFLSRIREFYADRFAADETSAKSISDALVKIGYGLLHTNVKSDKSVKLLNTTRNMNLVDLNYLGNFDSKNIKNAVAYDVFNPWASLIELSSTHPLIGKRLSSLGMVDITIDSNTKSKLWASFFGDSFVYLLNFITFVGLVIASFLVPNMASIFIGLGVLLSLVIAVYSVNFRYPNTKKELTDVKELQNDLFASPVRGKYVKLNGTAMGKGIPGFSLSEDFYLKDNTGFVFVNYEHWFPIMNWFVAFSKTNKLMDKNVEVDGWFFRSGMSFINADYIKSLNINMKSYSRFLAYFSELKYTILYVVLFLFFI